MAAVKGKQSAVSKTIRIARERVKAYKNTHLFIYEVEFLIENTTRMSYLHVAVSWQDKEN